jgi:hypothetical protein
MRKFWFKIEQTFAFEDFYADLAQVRSLLSDSGKKFLEYIFHAVPGTLNFFENPSLGVFLTPRDKNITLDSRLLTYFSLESTATTMVTKFSLNNDIGD